MRLASYMSCICMTVIALSPTLELTSKVAYKLPDFIRLNITQIHIKGEKSNVVAP